MTKKATFAMGCFWKPDEIFSKVPGVIETTVGYSGGHTENPSYEHVCSGKTGHAETLEIEYDPEKVSYEELLDVFWGNHDPTTLNRQGPDIGEQYRSAIFFRSKEQEKAAKESHARFEQSGTFKSPIVTEIVPASDFYDAEEYHQKYYEKQRKQ